MLMVTVQLFASCAEAFGAPTLEIPLEQDLSMVRLNIEAVLRMTKLFLPPMIARKRGRILKLKAGDVAVLPAGTGHQCLSATKDFLVVGAYPPTGKYDECTTSEDHERAVKTIRKVARPRKDPLYGARGPLVSQWRTP